MTRAISAIGFVISTLFALALPLVLEFRYVDRAPLVIELQQFLKNKGLDITGDIHSAMVKTMQVFQARDALVPVRPEASSTLRTKAADVDALVAKVNSQGYVRVILTLRGATAGPYSFPLPSNSTQQPSAPPSTAGPLQDGQSATIEQAQILATHLGTDETKRHRWSARLIRNTPYMAMNVTLAELEELAADSSVISITESGRLQLQNVAP